MKAKEIKQMTEKDIRQKIDELRKELIKHNAQIATGTQIKNPGQVRQTRKTIARLKTMLNEKTREVRSNK